MRSRDGDADSSGEGTSWLVLRHTPAEGLGLLANSLRDLGIHHRYLDLHRGDPLPRDLRGVGGLVVLGGPQAAYEADKHPFLAQESGLIERAITAGRPVLGICLGAQLIAQVLGGRVFAGQKREVGWGPVTLTEDGQDDRAELVRLQWSLRDPRGGEKRRAAEARVRELLLAGVRPCAPAWASATTGMQLTLIPPGRFRMGSPAKEPRRMADETLHTVTITRPFYLGVYPTDAIELALRSVSRLF